MFNAVKKSIRFISLLGEKSVLVVMDEAHQAIAETYKLILDTLGIMREDSKLIGLTATPGRSWADIEQDRKLAKFFHQNKVMMKVKGYDNPIKYLIAEKYIAKPNFIPLFYEGDTYLSKKDIEHIETELELPRRIIEDLTEDEQRNLLIINKIHDLAKKHKRIMVFAGTVEHSNLLAFVLKAKGLNAYSLTGEVPSYERTRIINWYKEDSDDIRILSNFGILTAGFDAPKTSAAMIARPTLSLVLYNQMMGRALRGKKAGGNLEADIMTIVDLNLPGFRDLAEGFLNWEDVWENK
jgi:superfamily II DNA or RNA helicase